MAIFDVKEKARARQNEAKNAQRQAEASEAQARADADAAERAIREAAEASKEQEREYRKREKELGTEVAALEATAADLLARPAPKGRPTREIRIDSRRFLIEGADLLDLAVKSDTLAGPAHDAGYRVARTLESIERELGVEHALADRCDAVECTLWGAFITRVRVLAGESA